MITEETALAVLLAKRAELTQRLLELEDDRRRHGSAIPADFAEQASACENDEVIDRLAEATRLALMQTQRALDYLDIGHYGVCTRCGGRISFARLDAVPEATECACCADPTNPAQTTESVIAG